ncbi:phage head closure protein [Halomonas sp. HP20-15]|uniref:phage head closure protein n=1 Tax=Halomonas sp. HP20-15 TaxID=3085901 RepID=UPI002980F004|nr:phage head closure protein [Halomonas sp. HP20-15]MDW5376837.1 phage head closure protein [Halomonas sp. HP20-15]
MRAGKLNKRITLQRKGQQQDPNSGATIDTWLDVSTVWAGIEYLSVREFIAARSGQVEISARITIRYRTGIGATMRAVRGDQIFNIHGVLPDNGSGREYLTLPVSEGANDG